MNESYLPYKTSNFSSNAIRPPINDNDKVYPCEDCGILRSKNEGGTVFTLCDDCWEIHYGDKRKLEESSK